ncbi:SigE family RNA polymerase sigma factor [Nocardioides aquiterrae]|uniref:SigE family RNA polymerase sigma factor n=1 Tax=Nocardioides aquiterrae TaxID=203799 RepID=A0ABN1U7D7_9ACTN
MEQDEDFTAFAGARWAALVRSGIVLGCTPEEAQDLAQTALLRCYTAWRKVAAADDRDAYVYRILVNCHRDSRRRRWWGERPAARLPDRGAADHAARVEVADAVHRALADLTASHREVVVLRYYADLGEQRTAEILGISPGTVKSRLARALACLAASSHLSDLPEGRPR